MGGCVVSVMESRNQNSIKPNDCITRYREYGPMSSPVPSIPKTGSSSSVYRCGESAQDEAFAKLLKLHCEGPTIVQQFEATCTQHKDAPRIAHRPVLKRVKETCHGTSSSRLLEVTYLDETQYITLGQLWNIINDFSRGLGALGVAKRSNIAIYEETRWEWLATIYGIWLQDMVAATVYANLGEDALFYALNETECGAIVCNGRSVPNLLRGIAAGSFKPCKIIYLDALPEEGCSDVGESQLISWQDVVALGQTEAARAQYPTEVPSQHDRECLIMYTSGTVADPKGVVHTYGSVTTGAKSMELFLDSNVPHDPSTGHETYCAYLPLAHILEFGVVNVFLSRGAVVGFGSPRTLTDVTARPHGDFQEFKPHIIIAVPRVYDTVRKAVEAKLPPPGTVKRQVFDTAYAARLAALKEGKDTPFYNEKVFKQARQALGGRFRLLLSGGGPLSAATQEFVNVVFGFIINGWGLTETVCVGAIQRLGDIDSNCTGQVLPMEELKLVDTEEYKHTDKPEPRGEICLRGPFLFKGYYKQPELTKEALDEDGWFHTGDVGSVTAEGRVRIIGRIKALAKNCLGEYIALEILESIYNNHPLVLNNCTSVLVHPDRNYISLLAVTDEAKAMAFAKKNKIKGTFPEILQDSNFLKAVSSSFGEWARQANRKPFECVRYVRLVTDEWTPENGMQTAAMKLKRRAINEKYAGEIELAFAAE